MEGWILLGGGRLSPPLPEITLPCTTLYAAPGPLTPAPMLPEISLPCTTLSVAPRPKLTPAPILSEITLRAPTAVPPIVLLDDSPIRTPAALLGTASSPVASVPMKLPSTTLFVAPGSMFTPAPILPEITLPAPISVPPIVLLDDPSIRTPLALLGTARSPVASVP